MTGEWASTAWWERDAIPCRHAVATPSNQCSEHTWVSTECETELDATGEPVKRCVKLYKRYLKCAGRTERVDEQKQELMARGEGAQQLEADLVPSVDKLPSGLRSAAEPGEQRGPQMEDVGHAVQEFLRFAEELQEQLVPGVMHLDQAPAAPSRPYSQAEDSQQQQQQQQQVPADQPFSWLGSLLFGKRRSAADGVSGARRQVDASMWREFESSFTET